MTPPVAMTKSIQTLTDEELKYAKLYCTKFDVRTKEQGQHLTVFENRLKVIEAEIVRRVNV